MEPSRKLATLEKEVTRLQSALAMERAKSEAFANASHEVRTLLNGVVGMTALLLDGELSSEQRDNAKRIRASGDALLALVNDFLDFAKAEQGRITLEITDVDVRRVAEEVGELVAERANARGLELVIHVALDVPPLLRGDATRLRQVLLNLVSNAIKFTEQGEVVLRVSHAERRGTYEVLRVEVSDTGVGIAAPWLERVFEPFTQAGSGHGGTGLGLAIAKRIVEAMGGQLGVTSEVGRGSTFFFTMPLERRGATSERSALPRIDLSHHRALVVAASSAVRAVLLEHLRALGLDAEARADEDLALSSLETATLRGKPFDFVFAETGSGGRRGAELAKRALERPGAQAARFVLMSYPGAPKPALGGNVVAHVWKPLRAADVASALQKARAPATEQVELRPGRVPEASQDATRRSTARHTVLVVEDDFVNQKVTVFQLQKRGYLADVASTAREAVERISQQPYALVLLDCHLPGIDGFEAAARIRARERELGLARTPLVALTADARPIVRDRCLAAGMDEFLTKPLQGHELDAVLERCAGPPGRARRTTANRPEVEAAQAALEPPPAAPPRRAGEDLVREPQARRAAFPGDERRPTDAAGHMPASRKRHTTTADRHDAPTEPPPPPTALDTEALARLKEFRKDSGALLLAELVEVFHADSRARLATLRESVAKHDPSTFHRTAHALKGSAAQLGVPSVSTLAARLEKLGRAGELREARPLLNALETEIERAYIALTAELEADPGSTPSSLRRNPTSRR
jgi:two-component system sensor histidine kinase/response regulator